MTDITEKDSENLHTSKGLLVLGLNRNGEIIQFNRECENITGYSRAEVLNRKISDFLIPKDYTIRWEVLFDSIKQNVWIDDFKIPLKTGHESELLISWSSFPIDNNGLVRNICLLGRHFPSDDVKKQSFKTFENKQHKHKDVTIYQNTVRQPRDKSKDKIIFKQKNKKIVFENKKRYTKSEKKHSTIKDSVSQAIETMKKPVESKPKEWGTMDRSIKELSKKYNAVNKKLKELEKKDRKLERKNKTLEKKLNHLKTIYTRSDRIKITKKQKDETMDAEQITADHKASSKKLPGFLYDPFGVKKKQEEFEQRIHTLDERKKELDEIEAQLIKDRKDINKRIAEFSNWKEKLVNLESEIEKRRTDLIEQEKEFRNSITHASHMGIVPSEKESSPVSAKDIEAENVDYHKILDKIPQSAAIVQRGILKQINSSFAELIGYEIEEIVDKSLFDFIAPEGFVEVEKYYLNRLKGDNSISNYKTVFFTKDNNKIVVEVSIKSATYDGETAEIAVINEMENQQKDSIKKIKK